MILYMFVRPDPKTSQFQAVLVDPVTRQAVTTVTRWSESGAEKAAEAWAKRNGYQLGGSHGEVRKSS